MKIVIIGPAHPLRGGLAAFDERLAHAFISEGDEVSIYSFSLQYPKLLFPGKTQFTDAPAPKGLKIFSEINSINPFNWHRVGKKIRDEKADMVIVAYWMPFMARALGRITRIIRKNGHSKVIALVHNLIPHEKRMGDARLSAFFLKGVDACVTLSRSVLDDVKQMDAKMPAVYSPHPLYDHYGEAISKEQAKANLGLDKNASYVLFFGFIRDYKGLDLLLEAFNDERVRALGLKLIIAGEYYSGKEKYDALIARYKLNESVINRNEFIPENKVADHFCAADIVVQPYKTATQSGVTQIAYHFNKPMIVTRTGGLPEMVPDGKVGYVVDTSANAIADALVRFYSGKKEDVFSKNALEEKRKYLWDSMTAKIKELFKSISK